MAMPDSTHNARAVPQPLFATTHWSVVVNAADANAPEAAAALERLGQAYWYPLYAYIRRRGYRPEDAQDLTQSFFARLLERNLLAVASPDRGRFRSFLLTTLRNFLADERDRAAAHKRGGGQPVLSLDEKDGEARYALEPADVTSPDQLFERRWATTLLEHAWTLLAAEYESEGKAELFHELKKFNSSEQSPPGYAAAAVQLGLPENTVKSLVRRMRQRYRALLRREVGHTVAGPAEVDEELRHLLQILAR